MCPEPSGGCQEPRHGRTSREKRLSMFARELAKQGEDEGRRDHPHDIVEVQGIA
jgi:hypothetical protein